MKLTYAIQKRAYLKKEENVVEAYESVKLTWGAR